MPTIAPETLYRRLQQHLDRMPVAFPPAPSGVEIRILQRLFTPEEAEIALELSAIPEPAATIHRRFGSRIPLDELRRKLEHMADKGIILSFPAGGEMRFGKLIFAIGMYERQLKTLTPEFERDSRQYSDEAFGRAFHTGKTTQLRIVPVNKQIAAERSVTTYDRIRDYIEESKKFARDKGYVVTLFGRKCHYPEIRASNASIRSFNERAAVNARLQGSAADIIRRAMIRMEDALAKQKLTAQMLLQVHDELVFEVPEAEVDKTLPVVAKVMEDAPLPAVSLSVPLKVEAHAADNWDAAH